MRQTSANLVDQERGVLGTARHLHDPIRVHLGQARWAQHVLLLGEAQLPLHAAAPHPHAVVGQRHAVVASTRDGENLLAAELLHLHGPGLIRNVAEPQLALLVQPKRKHALVASHERVGRAASHAQHFNAKHVQRFHAVGWGKVLCFDQVSVAKAPVFGAAPRVQLARVHNAGMRRAAGDVTIGWHEC